MGNVLGLSLLFLPVSFTYFLLTGSEWKYLVLFIFFFPYVAIGWGIFGVLSGIIILKKNDGFQCDYTVFWKRGLNPAFNEMLGPFRVYTVCCIVPIVFYWIGRLSLAIGEEMIGNALIESRFIISPVCLIVFWLGHLILKWCKRMVTFK